MQELVELLKERNLQISTMESCTGGGFANEITSIEGASEILKFSAVTYSNEYKIKMGVSREVIEKYSVYSIQTADEMSKNIAKFANSDIGIGITGKINRSDKFNLNGKDNIIFVSIYFRDNNKYYDYEVEAIDGTRVENKRYIVSVIINKLLNILEENYS